jgi:hypothetical protein
MKTDDLIEGLIACGVLEKHGNAVGPGPKAGAAMTMLHAMAVQISENALRDFPTGHNLPPEN